MPARSVRNLIAEGDRPAEIGVNGGFGQAFSLVVFSSETSASVPRSVPRKHRHIYAFLMSIQRLKLLKIGERILPVSASLCCVPAQDRVR